MLDLPGHTACPLVLNCFHFGNSCRPLQFSAGKNVLQMLGNRGFLHVEQCRHLLLRQPHRIPVQPHLQMDLAIWRFIQDHFAQPVTHSSSLSSASSRPTNYPAPPHASVLATTPGGNRRAWAYHYLRPCLGCCGFFCRCLVLCFGVLFVLVFCFHAIPLYGQCDALVSDIDSQRQQLFYALVLSCRVPDGLNIQIQQLRLFLLFPLRIVRRRKKCVVVRNLILALLLHAAK